MDQKDDNYIIERVLEGEKNSYAQLIEKYKGPIFNLAYRMTGKREEANDLAQEIFVRAYESLGRFDKRKRFFSWLYTISLNIIRNHLKRKGKVVFEKIDDTGWNEAKADRGNNPEEKIEEREAIERLKNTLKRISVEQKEAIVLRYYQGLSFEEIADVSLSTSKMRVYRGLEKLRKYMTD